VIQFSTSARLAGAPPQLAGDRQDAGFKISVDVDLVVLHATVRDKKGGFVSGLPSADFQVYEDGIPQTTRFFSHEDVPVTVGLVVDHSGSMRPKRTDVVTAALDFARSSNPRDEMFVVNFNEHAWLSLPAAVPFTSNPVMVEAALNRHLPTGRTALYDAIALALRHLKQADFDKRVLIVISDGGDNSSHYKWPEVRAMAQASNAIIYTVGLFDEEDPDWNPHVLKRLAAETGGEVFLPRENSAVVRICNQIARDIRNQYTIGYMPVNRRRDGTYRTIRLAVTSPAHAKLSVRTRAGYIAAAQPLPRVAP
jgi:Ca-activated chloride channel homolog